jgi:lysophospholipase L1-like esterase
MARKEGAAFLDTWSIWSEYVRSNGLLEDWLRRDSTHANARGKQAVARMLLCRLRPER